jgi:hypothetical protein
MLRPISTTGRPIPTFRPILFAGGFILTIIRGFSTTRRLCLPTRRLVPTLTFAFRFSTFLIFFVFGRFFPSTRFTFLPAILFVCSVITCASDVIVFFTG